MLRPHLPPEISFCSLSDEGGASAPTSAEPEPVLAAHADELALLAPGVCGKRRREFLLGRAAAHRAIEVLCGSSAKGIGRGPRGEPLWPPGLVGSISHTRGLALAVVARRENAAGLGIDVERRDRRISLEVARLVASAAEQAWVNEPPDRAEAHQRLLLLFSAKETLFKALFPIGGVYLGYKDAELRSDGDGFEATLLVAAAAHFGEGSRFSISCRRDEQHFLTWLVLPP